MHGPVQCGLFVGFRVLAGWLAVRLSRRAVVASGFDQVLSPSGCVHELCKCSADLLCFHIGLYMIIISLQGAYIVNKRIVFA